MPFKYFALNFNKLGLKKLIATCYATSPVMYTQLTLWGEEEPYTLQEGKKPYKIEITEVTDENGDGAVDLTDVEILLKSRKNVLTVLSGDGDFRSDECIELLKEADIIVTNPPFSLFRDYIALLMEYEKKFLIIGSMNAIHYKEVFPLIQSNKMWLGYGFTNGNAFFAVPEQYRTYASGVYDVNTGLVKFRNCVWYTNLDHNKRHEELDLYKKYAPAEYPKYENFDAINVNKVIEIPRDYYGMMGVPDTFLEKYNPDQFDIIGLAEGELGKTIGMSANLTEKQCKAFKEECKSSRKGNPIFRARDGKLHKPYSRIIIKRKDGAE